MFSFSTFKVAKCETNSRLCLGRIKLLRNKKSLQVKQYRKEIADLLKSGKQEYACIRVESVIRENLMLQAFEILELYVELLTVRTQLIAKTKEIPRDMVEAISSIIYAANRVNDMPEFTTLKVMFASKYGKEYAAEAGSDVASLNQKWQVNQNLIRCLLVEPPSPDDKLAMLSEIAQEHGVEWDLSQAARSLLPVGAVGGPAVQPTGGSALQQRQPWQQQEHLPQQHMSITDVHQAAQAAQAAANSARLAAEYAQQYAGQDVQQQPAQMRQCTQQYMPGTLADPPAQRHYLPLDSPAHSYQPPLQQHHGVQPLASLPPQLPQHINGKSASVSSTTQALHTGGFVERSPEEVQQAYDSAIGAPSKDRFLAHSAPTPGTPAPYGDVSTHSQHNIALNDFPPAPAAPTAPSAAPSEDTDFDELSRRLDALRRA